MSHFISKNQYNQLKTEGFGIEKAAQDLGLQETFDAMPIESLALEGSISKLSSFATWPLPQGDSWDKVDMRKVMTNSHNHLLNWDGYVTGQRDTLLHSGVVMLGVNAGTGGTEYQFDDFEIFHDNITGPHKAASNIKKYLPDLMSTVLNGSYLTDVYKGLPTSDASALTKEFKKWAANANLDYKEFRDNVDKIFAQVLINELSIVGIPKYFIIMGSEKSIVNRVLDAHPTLQSIERLYLIHYSSSGPKGTTGYHRQAVRAIDDYLNSRDYSY